MKRTIALLMAVLLMLSLCACGGNPSGNTDGTGSNQGNDTPKSEVIARELQGAWYGPYGQPMLIVNADGTGTVILDKDSYSAIYTAENNVFTVASEGYNLSGDYTIKDEKLTIKFTYNSVDYTLIFTRTPVEHPDGSYIYNYNDVTYELIPKEGIIVEDSFPPEDNPPTIEIYLEYVSEKIIHVYPRPPIVIFTGETATSPTAPSEPEIPVPEVIDTGNEPPVIKIGGTDTEVYESSDDITGTWTTVQDGTVSFFGVTNSATVPITYTFNADGTGTILAMGMIPGTMTYSVDNGVLNLTVSMLGDTESGTGYVKRIGDKLLVKNQKGEVQTLVKQG